jgi:hypothetical protein
MNWIHIYHLEEIQSLKGSTIQTSNFPLSSGLSPLTDPNVIVGVNQTNYQEG